MKHLSLNLEPLEKRTVFSVPAAEVVELPPPLTDLPGPGPGEGSAVDAFLKVSAGAFERGAEFFHKDVTPGSPDGFLKAREAAMAQGTRFLLKVSPQEPF